VRIAYFSLVDIASHIVWKISMLHYFYTVALCYRKADAENS